MYVKYKKLSLPVFSLYLNYVNQKKNYELETEFHIQWQPEQRAASNLKLMFNSSILEAPQPTNDIRSHQLFSWNSSERLYHLIMKILLRSMKITLSLYDPRWALQPSLLRPVKLLTHLHSTFLLCATNPINKWCLSSFWVKPLTEERKSFGREYFPPKPTQYSKGPINKQFDVQRLNTNSPMINK